MEIILNGNPHTLKTYTGNFNISVRRTSRLLLEKQKASREKISVNDPCNQTNYDKVHINNKTHVGKSIRGLIDR